MQWSRHSLAVVSSVLALTVVISSLLAATGWFASAATPGTLFSLSVQSTTCDTGTTDEKCTLSAGSTFVLEVSLDALGNAPDYAGLDIFVTYTGVNSKSNASTASWPECAFPAAIYQVGTARFGCAAGISQPNSTYTGVIGTLSFNCVASGSINCCTERPIHLSTVSSSTRPPAWTAKRRSPSTATLRRTRQGRLTPVLARRRAPQPPR